MIILNGLVFLYQQALPPLGQTDFALTRGFVPKRLQLVNSGKELALQIPLPPQQQPRGVRDPRIRPAAAKARFREVVLSTETTPTLATMITCMFLHGGWLHLVGNMWFLWIFGNNIEDHLGHIRFVLFYLVCGLIASLVHFAFDPSSPIPTIGASGAIAGVLGAYAVTYPYARVRTLVFLLVFVTMIDLPALIVLGAWFLLDLFNAQQSLVGGNQSGVAVWAHVGGFVAGTLLIWLFSLGSSYPRTKRRRFP